MNFFKYLFGGKSNKSNDDALPTLPIERFDDIIEDRFLSKDEKNAIRSYVREYKGPFYCTVRDYGGEEYNIRDRAYEYDYNIRRSHRDSISYGGYETWLSFNLHDDMKLSQWQKYKFALDKGLVIKDHVDKGTRITYFDWAGFNLVDWHGITIGKAKINSLHNFEFCNPPADLKPFVNGTKVIQCDVRTNIKFEWSDEDFLNAAIKHKNEKDAAIFKMIDETADELIKAFNCFPGLMYHIEITDTDKKRESFLTTSQPIQLESSSFKIQDVLFRDAFFAIIPAVMYKISVVAITRKELRDMFVSCANGKYPQKLIDAINEKEITK